MGASIEEKCEGTAVTGIYDRKIKLPPGVVGEQMPHSAAPGPRFLRRSTPRLLKELNAAKGTTEEYAELKTALVNECGGRNITGWKTKKIEEVIRRFQPRFNAKGVEVLYNVVKFWVGHHPQGGVGSFEYRYWLEFSDVNAVAQHAAKQKTNKCVMAPRPAFDPTPPPALAA